MVGEARLQGGPHLDELAHVVAARGEHAGEVLAVRVALDDQHVTVAGDRVAGRAQHLLGAAGVGHAHPEAGHALTEQVLDAPRGQQPALPQDAHRVADLLDLGEDVRAQQDRGPGLAELADEVADLADPGRVEAVGGLVEDEQVGLLHQGRRDRQALLHPQRVGVDVLAGAVGQAHLGQRGGDLLAGDAAGAGEEQEVLARREAGHEPRLLDQRAHAADDLGQAVGDRPVEEPDLAAGGPGEAEQHLQGRGLAGAVGAEEAVDTSRGHGQVQAVDGDDAPGQRAVDLAQAPRLDDQAVPVSGFARTRSGVGHDG